MNHDWKPKVVQKEHKKKKWVHTDKGRNGCVEGGARELMAYGGRERWKCTYITILKRILGTHFFSLFEPRALTLGFMFRSGVRFTNPIPSSAPASSSLSKNTCVCAVRRPDAAGSIWPSRWSGRPTRLCCSDFLQGGDLEYSFLVSFHPIQIRRLRTLLMAQKLLEVMRVKPSSGSTMISRLIKVLLAFYWPQNMPEASGQNFGDSLAMIRPKIIVRENVSDSTAYDIIVIARWYQHLSFLKDLRDGND